MARCGRQDGPPSAAERRSLWRFWPGWRGGRAHLAGGFGWPEYLLLGGVALGLLAIAASVLAMDRQQRRLERLRGAMLISAGLGTALPRPAAIAGRRDRSAAAGGGQPDRPGARPARPARPPAGSRAGRHRRWHRGGDIPGPGEPDQCRRQAPARRRDRPRRQPVRRLRAREPGLRHDPGGGGRTAAAHDAAPGRWAGDRGRRRRARARGRGGAALRRGGGDCPAAPGA